MLSKSGFATIMPIVNMKRALKFYTEALGGTVVMEGQGDMKGWWSSVKIGTEEFWLVKPQKKEKRALSYSVFIVDNIRKTVKELQGSGVKFEKAERMGEKSKLEGPIAFEEFGASAFFKDSEGNLLMIWQNSMPG